MGTEMPKLIVSIDGVVIKEVELNKSRSTLGRRPYNDIVIDNLAVSGEHVAFLLSGTEVTLEDLNSTNGTYVNGNVVKKHVLQNDDVVEVGKYQIKLSSGTVEDPGESPNGFRASVPYPSSLYATQSGLSLPGAKAQGIAPATIRVLSGAASGREVPLTKVVTTVGKPGVSVASITRRQQGYVLSHLEGPQPLLLNGTPVGKEAVSLTRGDTNELAETHMQFTLL